MDWACSLVSPRAYSSACFSSRQIHQSLQFARPALLSGVSASLGLEVRTLTTRCCYRSFSRRVTETLSRTSSWKERQASAPATKGVKELLAIAEGRDTPGSSSAGEDDGLLVGEEEKDARGRWSSRSTSRRAALQGVLSMLDDQVAAHKKSKSVAIDELALELGPLPS